MDINVFAADNNLKDKDIVAILKPDFPGVDRPLVVKVKNPERYGIEFIKEAEVLILGHAFKTSLSARKTIARGKRYTLRFDTTKAKLGGVHRLIIERGYTITAGMNRVVDYLLEHPEILEKGKV